MATPSLSHLLHASNLPDTHPQIDPPSNHSSQATAAPVSGPSPSSIVPVAPTTAPNLAPASTTPLTALPTVPSATATAAPLPPVQSVDDVNPTQLPASRSHASNASLYQCADCQRRYSRPEHLARHIQTHTLGKRFGCQVCGKLFARADLLKRHTLNHQSDNDSKKRRKTDPGAGRVSHACRPCATARVKCEEIKPCSRCRNRNLTCEYASSEAGSAAAMHLLHLSKSHSAATGPSTPNPNEQLPRYAPQHPQHNPDTPTVPLGLQSTVSGSSPVSTRNHANPEASQLPTPDTAIDQSNSEFNAPFTGGENVMDMARLPFSDFLRDVLYDTSLDASRIDQAPQGLAVLDFCDDSNLNLNDLDFDLLDHWNIDSLAPSAAQIQTPRADDNLDISAMRQKVVKIWGDSPWRWSPKTQDSGYREQGNLAVPAGDVISPQFRDANRRVDRVIKERLEPSGRDKILAIVLSTVKTNTILQRVASSFPSAEVFDALIHAFLASHMCSVSEFIHFPTFKLNQQWPEWLATVASAGAILTPIQTLRKLGYALQEAVRLTIPARFEDNNTSIQDLGAVQAFVLVQDIGLWSGNKRKMEIAECHLLIPITMMRYRGKFQRSNYPIIAVDPSDEGEVLQEKWRKWYELESWKRLVFHAYLRDAQVSMTTFTNTSMSYAELTLPLPEARELWFAKSAQEWKMHYLDRTAGHSKRPPSLGDLLRDINLLTQNLRRLDVQFSISIFLHGFWSLILEYRQLNAIHRNQAFSNSLGGNPGLLLTSRHQELCKQLQNFQSLTSDWASHPSLLSNQESLVLHLVQMNLHVSLDDLQLFGGKEGEDQARRIYPVLKRWAAAPDSRQALWNAGQIIRQAKMFPAGHLKDFYAVAVHHAALALWTYGVVNKAAMRQPISQVTPYEEVIYLDGNHTIAVGRWIASGIGKAVIRGPGTGSEGAAGGIDGNAGGMEANITEPRACAEVVQEVLRVNFSGDQDSLPAIVENLCHLVKQLGNAAWAVGLAST